MDRKLLSAILASLEPGATSIDPLLLDHHNRKLLLHKAVRLRHPKKLAIVQFLIKTNLADSDERDDAGGLTASEVALSELRDRELASAMLAAEMERVTDERGFFVAVIRRGSVPVCELFLELKRFKEGEIFRHVSSAMIELDAKRVVIAEGLRLFLQYQLVRFGHKYIGGDVGGVVDRNAWRTHFAAIEEHWAVLERSFSDRDCNKFDSEFLYRIRMMHNHLYFVKNVAFLSHLPVMEMAFCLAVFVKILECDPEYELYKFLINKLDVMKYLKTINRQLQNVKRYLDELKSQLNDLVESLENDKIPTKEEVLEKWKRKKQNELIKVQEGASEHEKCAKKYVLSVKLIKSSENLQENIVNSVIGGLKRKETPVMISDKIVSKEVIVRGIRNFNRPIIKVETNMIKGKLRVQYKWQIHVNGRDKSVLKKLKRNFIKMKQFHSITKVVEHIDRISPLRVPSASSIKRLVQVLGEASKFTKKSPNISKKAVQYLKYMKIETFTERSKVFREFFSHKYSLAKQILKKPMELQFTYGVSRNLIYIELIYSILIVYSLNEISRTFLGSLRGCRNTEELILLLRYASNLESLKNAQSKNFNRVKAIFKELRNSPPSTGSEQLKSRASLFNSAQGTNYDREEWKRKEEVFNLMKECLIQNWLIGFQDIKIAVLANAPLATIHRMIGFDFSSSESAYVYNLMVSSFAHYVPKLESSLSKELVTVERRIAKAKDEDYKCCTKKIIKQMGIENPSSEEVNEWHKKLSKYYENIFFIDEKFRAITAKTVPKEKLQEVRKSDQDDIQLIFNNHLETLRNVLRQFHVHSIDDLAAQKNIPDHAILELEYNLLEMCEMLLSVGYYGDNFHLLKHKLPFVSGRNFRNYLAHDSLSYNVITGTTSRSMVIVNALVFIDSPLQLFKKRKSASFKESYIPSEKQTLVWTLENIDSIKVEGTAGSNANETLDSEKIVGFESDRLLNPIRKGEQFERKPTILESSFYNFPLMENFEETFHRFSNQTRVKNSTLPQAFFSWKLIVDRLKKLDFDWNETDSLGRTILHRLIQAGNEEGVADLLQIEREIDVNARDSERRTPLDYAMAFGNENCARMLASKMADFSDSNQLMAVILHMNDCLKMHFQKLDPKLIKTVECMKVAVFSSNSEILKELSSNIDAEQLAILIHTAAAVSNHVDTITCLCTNPNVDYSTESMIYSLSIALYMATLRNNRKIAELSISFGASPNWTNPHTFFPMESAFQLAVQRNDRKLVKMMNKNVTITFSRHILNHPLQLAVKNHSKRMVRCLEGLGYSLLDTGHILHSAIESDNSAVVEEIFEKLNVTYSAVKTTDLYNIEELLLRWRTLAYLEEPVPGFINILTYVANKKDTDLLERILSNCKEIRKFGHFNLYSLQIFQNHKLTQSFFCDDCAERPSLLKVNQQLLIIVNTTSKSTQSKRSGKLTLTLKNSDIKSTIVCHFTIFVENGSEPDINSLKFHKIIQFDLLNTSEKIFTFLLVNLQHIKHPIFGMFRNDMDQTLNHFIILEETAYLMQSTKNSPDLPLKSFVNFTDHLGVSVLQQFCDGEGGFDGAKLLIEHGANPLAMNRNKHTPLHQALLTTSSQESLRFLNLYVENDWRSSDGMTRAIEMPNAFGLSPLHAAVTGGHAEVVRFLIDCGVNLRARFEKKSLLPVMLAPKFFHTQIMKLLLDADPAQVNIPDADGNTVAHYAMSLQMMEIVQLVLQYEVNLKLPNQQGESPIEIVIFSFNAEIVKYVLNHARSNHINNLLDDLKHQQSPIIHHVLLNFPPQFATPIVEYLIDADLNDQIPPANLEELKLLLLTREPKFNSIALHAAANCGRIENCRFILNCQNLYNRHSKNKVKLARNQYDIRGLTPWELAIEGKQKSVLDLFREDQ